MANSKKCVQPRMVSHELGFITLIWVHSWRSQRGLQVSTSGFQMFRCWAAHRQNDLDLQKDPHTHEFHHEKKCAEKLRVSSEHHTPASSLQSHQHLLLWHRVCHVFIQPQSPFLFNEYFTSCAFRQSLMHPGLVSNSPCS